MVRSRLLLALVVAACGRSDATLPTKPQSTEAPAESRPVRVPWVGQIPPAGPGHLGGGSIRASAKVAALVSLMPENTWFDALEPNSFVTATLARPIDGALHHRFGGVLRVGKSWPGPRAPGPPCPSVGPLSCVTLPGGNAYAYVRTKGRALTVDIITHGEANEQAVLDASNVAPTASAAPQLVGDMVMRSNNGDLASALAQTHVPAFDGASIELTQRPGHLRARLRWAPPSAWSPRSSTSPAPSWDALCSGALACARTGPWPNIQAWLQSLGTAERPQGSALAAVSMWSSTWPHEFAAAIATLRDRSPEVSRGFINAALSGLAEIEFSGARLDDNGVFIAFVRIPARWVNFTASVLPYVGLRPGLEPAGNAEITWAPLQRGGIALALDDGPDPTMGWIAIASSPERFAWLMDAPRTRAQSSALTARIARIQSVTEHLPEAWRSWLSPYGNRTATLRVEVEEGRLSASADLDVRP